MLEMISLVIPTYNRLTRLRDCLHSVTKLAHTEYEILVVNDGSTDGTRAYLDSLTDPRITVIHHEKNRGQSQARTSGFCQARGTIVAFTDDDCIVDSHWLNELESAVRFGSYDFVFGATFYVNQQYQGYFPERLTSNGGGRWPGGANIAFTKKLLDRIGSFESTFDEYHNEDTELAIRAVASGARYGRVPQALVYHQPETWTIRSLLASSKNLAVWPVLKKMYPIHYLAFGGPARWRVVVEPSDYIKIALLPLLIPLLLVRYWYHGKRGLLIFFTKWPVWILMRRWQVIRQAIRQRVFMV